jgi:hypothetical protein
MKKLLERGVWAVTLLCLAMATASIAIAQAAAPEQSAKQQSATQDADLPDSPGTTLAALQAAQAQDQEQNQDRSSQSPQSPPSAPATAEPLPSPSDTQQRPQKPVGTAAAEPMRPSGIAASQPAGVAVAPAKQRRVRTIIIRTGAIIAAGVAVGSVVALTAGTSSKPPGAH